MNKRKKETKENKGLPFFGIGKILPFAARFRVPMAIMLMCSLLGSSVDIILPLYQRYALNHFVGGGTLDTLPWYIIIYFVTIVGAGIANYYTNSIALKIEVSMNRDLRNAAFSHLQTLSFSYYNQNSVGYIHARVMSDTSRIGSLVSWSLADGLWHMTYLVG